MAGIAECQGLTRIWMGSIGDRAAKSRDLTTLFLQQTILIVIFDSGVYLVGCGFSKG
jgi:hypothetical protein